MTAATAAAAPDAAQSRATRDYDAAVRAFVEQDRHQSYWTAREKLAFVAAERFVYEDAEARRGANDNDDDDDKTTDFGGANRTESVGNSDASTFATATTSLASTRDNSGGLNDDSAPASEAASLAASSSAVGAPLSPIASDPYAWTLNAPVLQVRVVVAFVLRSLSFHVVFRTG